jgi:D-inositol-3-phosphate glycosyltransferase
MKILMVTEYFPPHVGGVELVFEMLSKKFTEHGHQVQIITTNSPRSKEKFAHIHRITVPKILERFLFMFLAIPTTVRLAKKSDLIQTTTLAAAFPAWIASKITGKPCALMVHEFIGKRWHKLGINPIAAALYRTLERLIFLPKFTHYSTISKATEADLLEHIPSLKGKTGMIYHGVETKTPSTKPPKQPNFTLSYFGRPGTTKGAHIFIQALAIANKKLAAGQADSGHDQPIKAQMIMSKKPAAAHKNLLKLIAKLNLEENIQVLPSTTREKLFKILLTSHGIVIPSLTEGFGFSAVEACSLGLPIIASNSGSLPEVVYGKVILAETGNPQDFARAILDLQANKWQEIPEKIFSWDKAAKSHIQLYTKLIAKN